MTIKSTDEITFAVGHEIPCRVWSGITEQGVRCKLFVPLIAVHKDADSVQFDRELEALPKGRVVDLREVLP